MTGCWSSSCSPQLSAIRASNSTLQAGAQRMDRSVVRLPEKAPGDIAVASIDKAAVSADEVVARQAVDWGQSIPGKMRRGVMQGVQIIMKEQQAENRRLDDCRA